MCVDERLWREFVRGAGLGRELSTGAGCGGTVEGGGGGNEGAG